MLSTTRFPLPSIWQTDLAVPLSSTDPVVGPYHADVASVGCTGGAGGGGDGNGCAGDGDGGGGEGGVEGGGGGGEGGGGGGGGGRRA